MTDSLVYATRVVMALVLVCSPFSRWSFFVLLFSRLNFVYTVLSKRKLQWFVETKRVTGWDDARFPTIQGILRRGMRVEALREFILGQGFSMASNTMEWDKIWTINKRHIDPVAPRYTGITAENRAVLEIANVDGSASELVSVDLHPKNPAIGKKVITRSNRVLLEQDDAKLIKDGEEVSRTRPSLALAIAPSSSCVFLMTVGLDTPRLWFADFKFYDDKLMLNFLTEYDTHSHTPDRHRPARLLIGSDLCSFLCPLCLLSSSGDADELGQRCGVARSP